MCDQLGKNELNKKNLAGAVGFEPTNADSKNRCLTTWRRPKNTVCMCFLKILNTKYCFRLQMSITVKISY